MCGYQSLVVLTSSFSHVRFVFQGDWAKSFNYLKALNAWNLVPRKDLVLSMLKVKVQEEAVRTYLLTYSSQYASLSLDQLASMFELPDKQVRLVNSSLVRHCIRVHGSPSCYYVTVCIYAPAAPCVRIRMRPCSGKPRPS
jgi:hypothetical protein